MFGKTSYKTGERLKKRAGTARSRNGIRSARRRAGDEASPDFLLPRIRRLLNTRGKENRMKNHRNGNGSSNAWWILGGLVTLGLSFLVARELPDRKSVV